MFKSSLRYLSSSSSGYRTEHILSPTSKERCIKRIEKMNSLRPAGVDVTKKAGILVPLVDIEASLMVRVRRSSVRARRSSEWCAVAQKDAT